MLVGVQNFRDFGGYAAGGGRRIKRGLLFRSARPAAATEADEAVLHGLGLSTIVDLRRGGERRGHPTGAWSARYATITSDLDGDADPWPLFLRRPETDAAAIRGYMFDFYRAAPYEGRHIDLFSRYFHALAANDGAMLVHCAVGKDRTGIIVGLTHVLLGVDQADILGDYLQTNRHWNYENHGALVTRVMSEEAGRPIGEEAVRAALEIRPDYLNAAFEAIRARNGSIEAYLEDVLGVDSGRRERIVARLVEAERV